jgi:hypothetical protein
MQMYAIWSDWSIVKMQKPKPKVSPIIIPDDKLQFLKKKLDDPDLSQSIKREFVKEIMGGECAMCQGMPTKIASYDMDGITLIEKYCDKCFEESNF